MHILVTGGCGYIGSHTVIELLNKGNIVTIADNLINSNKAVIERIQKITGSEVDFVELDLIDTSKLKRLFSSNSFDAVIHFAGLKAVADSVLNPLSYYRTNVDSTLSLIEVMKEYKVLKLIFSSSATVYGSAKIPYSEESITGQGITSPYGQTKYMIEQILKDMCIAYPDFEVSILRYFNPVGAHSSGFIGEDPKGIPNNLMPYISQVAAGVRSELTIFGNDYNTPDGTCIRDYIHVTDLALGHISALSYIRPGVSIYNLGSGHGTSVLEMVHAFERVSKVKINYRINERRFGDLELFYADTKKAATELKWITTKTIDDMCADTWNWQSKNPNGYET